MSTDSIVSELQNLSPSAIIELFELQLKNNLHGSDDVYYFHSGSSLNLNGKIRWNGKDYLRFPIEATGFEYTGGKLPRPQLIISNATNLVSALLIQVNQVTPGNDLIGSIFTRKRTLARFLPNDNFVGDNPSGAVDETAEFPKEIYTVARKSSENREVVQFELAAPLDLENIRAPKRICTRKNFPSIGTFFTMNWKESALNHAKEQDPKESCGLLLNIRGKERYHPCKNLAETSYQSFILDPTDYVKATKKGEIIGVVHSHPSTPPIASQADMVSCEKENYKWYIVNPKTEQWGYYEPCGYKAPLLGREWVWGVTDCWSLVRDYYNEVLGIKLIDFDRTMTPDEFIKNPLFVSCAEKTGFRRLNPDEPLMENDVLCMNMVGNGLHHVALFTKGEVLHHLTDRLSCREPYSAWLQKCTGAKYRYDN